MNEELSRIANEILVKEKEALNLEEFLDEEPFIKLGKEYKSEEEFLKAYDEETARRIEISKELG